MWERVLTETDMLTTALEKMSLGFKILATVSGQYHVMFRKISTQN
jgi:hypothetical protein